MIRLFIPAEAHYDTYIYVINKLMGSLWNWFSRKHFLWDSLNNKRLIMIIIWDVLKRCIRLHPSRLVCLRKSRLDSTHITHISILTGSLLTPLIFSSPCPPYFNDFPVSGSNDEYLLHLGSRRLNTSEIYMLSKGYDMSWVLAYWRWINEWHSENITLKTIWKYTNVESYSNKPNR